MVIKLVKREFSESKKAFIPVLGAILVGSLLFAIQIKLIENSSMSSFSLITNFVGIILFSLFISVIVLSIRASLTILYSSMYGEGGYELFTLPVKGWQIIVAKVITLTFWSILSTLVGIVGGLLITLILTGSFDLITEAFRDLSYVFRNIFTNENTLIILLSSFVASLKGLALIFLAGSIANSSLISKRRALMTFVIIVLINFVISNVMALTGVNETGFMSVYFSGDALSFDMDTARVLILTFIDFLWVGIFTFGTIWFWENKLEILN